LLLLLDNVATLRDVETVQELSDILVADSADLLDVGSGLRDLLEIVTGELELVLDVLGSLDIDTVGQDDATDDLLAQEVSDLNLHAVGLVVLLEVDVDGEMGVDVAHLVLVALGDTDDHVVDESADGTESGDVLAGTVVHLDGDNILLGVRERDGQVREILLEDTTGAGDGDLSGLDVDLDTVGNGDCLLRVNVLHFGEITGLTAYIPALS